MTDDRFREHWRTIKATSPLVYRQMIALYEEIAGSAFKKVTNVGTGKSYRVPVELIVTEGIRAADLDRFPKWEESEPPCEN